MKKTLQSLLLAGISAAVATVAFAQNGPGPRRPGRGPGPHGPGPIIGVLDANHDGVISADEIANASTSLKTLDQNGDGALSLDELRPPRPADAPPMRRNAGKHHPASPLMLALDANGDGTLSATEIANAPTSLKALDANHDGQLTPEEFCPVPPDGMPPPQD